jgi:hypothetical protein
MSRIVYCNVNMTAFDVIALSCGQQGSGSSYTTMHICSQHYQRIFISTSNHNAAACAILFRFVTFRFSLIPTTQMSIDRLLTFRPFRQLWQNSSSTYQSAYQNCFKDLQKHWKWCTDARRSYFIEDPLHKSVSTLYSFLYHQSWNLWT